MKLLDHLKRGSIGGLLLTILIPLGIILITGVLYFYIYLPSLTNHLESITVPDLTGLTVDELGDFVKKHDLRYAVNDSSYSASQPPLTVLGQFPQPGSIVKQNRVVFVSLNRVQPPTLPMPDLEVRSLLNAEVVLKSLELKRGRIFYRPYPFRNLVLEMQHEGVKIIPGTRITKGSVIDFVVGDGNGPADFTIGNLIGDPLETAKFKLRGWSLHLGSIQIPAGVDTTGLTVFVYKQYPAVGDSVRVGDPVDLWIGPRGYTEPDDTTDENELM
ncbi:MAG: PASTA domain-containing protein [Cyclobacteriaceae bacterium]|nr:PASTA domain-containing protein [Cytophagales bacterium]MBX2900133.1 PASTA domain-containing protein [Cyclobacteriaceae bacterium]